MSRHEKNEKAFQSSLLGVLGAIVYISVVSFVMTNGDRIFGRIEGSLFGPMLFLMLFVLSAMIVGVSLLGRPAYLFLTGKREEPITVLVYTILLFFILTALGFSIFAILNI